MNKEIVLTNKIGQESILSQSFDKKNIQIEFNGDTLVFDKEELSVFIEELDKFESFLED